jgi:cytochrome c-type biogenesis protein CcmH/NrfF
MEGMTLTLPKILLLLVVAWLAWRFLKRHNIVGGNKAPQPRSTANQKQAEGAIEDMVKCPKCSAYVPVKGGHDCPNG